MRLILLSIWLTRIPPNRHGDSFYSGEVLHDWAGILKGDEELRKLQALTGWLPPAKEFDPAGPIMTPQLAALIDGTTDEVSDA